MKITMTIIIAGFANCVFALTETINGITWSYVGDMYGAKLEYPDIRASTAKPNPAHAGDLPTRLDLPKKLGGFDVTAIGAAAFQLPADSGIKLITIPETVSSITKSSFLGEYLQCQNSGSGYYLSYAHQYNPIHCDVLFLGDKPTRTDDSYYWDVYSGKWRFAVSCYAFSYDYGYNYDSDHFQFGESNCYVVQGTEGWALGEMFHGAQVSYGAAKVSMSDDNGVIGEDGVVELSCPNETATIYYTLDGSEPITNGEENCFIYSAPLVLAHRATIKALAHVREYPYVVTYAKDLAFGRADRPAILPNEGATFNWSGYTVSLACETEDAEIRYTLDGKEPTEKSSLYTVPFAIDDTTTIKAKAFKEDWFESETATATFTREWYTVETPVISPGNTTFANASQEVSVSCGTEGATIYYTTDGTDPATNGHEYKRPFCVYTTCTIRAIASKCDWKNSAEATATMTRGEPLSAAANLYGYKMGTNTDKPWVVDAEMSHDGVSSIRSNGDGSYVQTSVNGKGTLSFWWRAMCEEPGYEWYDHGAFKTGGDTVTRIAGEDTGWVYYSMSFSTLGKHVLRWEYNKDDEGDFSPDCVWVDQVQWVPADGSGFTLTTPEPVPYSWLAKYNLGVAEGDFEAAANAANGKTSWGKPMSVWQDYVAGTDPTNLDSRLTAYIEMRGDSPLVTWDPDLNTNGTVRIYKVYGSKTLENGDNWQYPANSLHRFFKVKVELP